MALNTYVATLGELNARLERLSEHRTFAALAQLLGAANRAALQSEDFPGSPTPVQAHVLDLLGLVFVLAQREITHWLAAVDRIRQRLAEDGGPGLELPEAKGPLLARVAAVTVVDAAASFFRHHEQWGEFFIRRVEDRAARATVREAERAGVEHTYADSLHELVEAAGMVDCTDVPHVVAELARWGRGILADLRQQLVELGKVNPDQQNAAAQPSYSPRRNA